MECDLSSRNRKRENVDGRMMFALIAHDRPYNLTDGAIARIVKRDRTSVIHYRKIMSFNVKNSTKYISYYNKILSMISVDEFLGDNYYKKEVEKLRETLVKMSKEIEDLKAYKDAWKKAPRFHGYVNEKFWEDVTEDELSVIKYLLRDVKKKRTSGKKIV